MVLLIGFGFLLVLAAVLAGAGAFTEVTGRGKRNGWHVLTYRWFGGHCLDGKIRTDATWREPASRVLHPKGRAHRWHWVRGWRRAAVRCGSTALVLLTGWGLLTARRLTIVLLAVILAPLAAWVILRGANRARTWRHERYYVRPLRRTLVKRTGMRPIAVTVRRDGDAVRSVAIDWAAEAEIGAETQQAVLSAVTTRLPIEAPDKAWELKGRTRSVTFTQSEPPPSAVSWDDVAALVTALAHKELAFGLGKRSVPVKRTYSESPHLIIAGGSGGGKALALDTRLPTPSGWTGAPSRVIAATDVMHGRPCYEVEFSDGSVIVADAEHQWLAEDADARKSFGRVQNPPPTCPARVLTTEVMARSLRARRTYKCDEVNYSVKVAGALQCPDADLPVPPYTLGAWLGDGATVTGSITSADDDETISEICAEGEIVWAVPSTIQANHASYRVKGLSVRLRDLGVLDNKHIPVSYLRASEDQRRALLAGLLDTDGYCNDRGGIRFYSTLKRLARDVLHLVTTLGYKASLSSKTARLYGKDCGLVWIVSFTAADKVFRLPRKLARQVTKVRPTAGRRYVTDIRPVPSVPVRCIEVDSPSKLYLVGETCIPTHNSNLAAFLLLQELHRGSLIFNLDPKWISHLWMQNLPNVINAHDAPDLHMALAWLGKELLRRTKAAYWSAGGTGRIRANVGTRIIVVCEELNYGMPGLKEHWREVRTKEDPKRSPALAGLQALSCAGRAADMHEWLMAQMLTVESTGVKDSTIRGNAGHKAMVRWELPGWVAACGKHVPMPAPPTIPGRIQVVSAGKAQETQVPYLHLDDDDEEVAEKAVRWAREFAVSGVLAQIPSGPDGIPQELWPPCALGQELPAIGAGQGPGALGQVPPGAPWGPDVITLRDAVEAGYFGTRTLETVRSAAKRDPMFPRPASTEGVAGFTYDDAELRQYASRKAGRTVMPR
jgi:hypothetical protein